MFSMRNLAYLLLWNMGWTLDDVGRMSEVDGVGLGWLVVPRPVMKAPGGGPVTPGWAAALVTVETRSWENERQRG